MSDVESDQKGNLQAGVGPIDDHLVTKSGYEEAGNENGDVDDVARVEKVYRYADLQPTLSLS